LQSFRRPPQPSVTFSLLPPPATRRETAHYVFPTSPRYTILLLGAFPPCSSPQYIWRVIADKGCYEVSSFFPSCRRTFLGHFHLSFLLTDVKAEVSKSLFLNSKNFSPPLLPVFLFFCRTSLGPISREDPPRAVIFFFFFFGGFIPFPPVR